MSITAQSWQARLEKMEGIEPEEKAKLAKALSRLQQLIEERFAGRLDYAFVDFTEFSPEEKRCPLYVRYPCKDEGDQFRIQRELIHDVIVPAVIGLKLSLPPVFEKRPFWKSPKVDPATIGIIHSSIP